MFPVAPVAVICGMLEGKAGTISLGCWAPLDAWVWTGFGASWETRIIKYKNPQNENNINIYTQIFKRKVPSCLIDVYSKS